MNLSKDEIIEKYAKHCSHCSPNTLLPYEYEFTCFSCGYNIIKRKHELSKVQRKRINFINRLKFTEHKVFCICEEEYRIYEGSDYRKKYEALSILKSQILKITNILIEKYKDIDVNKDFGRDFYSRTAIGIY